MEAYALHKSAMIAPRKARMTLDLIRGKKIDTARGILANTNTKASRLIVKVLNSAIANAVNNNGAKEDDLVVSTCYINPGPVYKRMKYGSRTKVDRRDKRTSHIYVLVSEVEQKEVTAPIKEVVKEENKETKKTTEKKVVKKETPKKKITKKEEA